MSAACRHCVAAVAAAAAPASGGGGGGGGGDCCGDLTYASSLVIGRKEVLLKRLEDIEANPNVMNGVKTMCENCGRCSIISYPSYLYMHQKSRCTDPPMGWQEYYTHMCDLAERLSGEPVGFTVERPREPTVGLGRAESGHS